jgi:hypothetical protein
MAVPHQPLVKFIENSLQTRRTNMYTPPTRRKKIEIQVHIGIKGVRNRGFAESKAKRKRG